MLETAHHRTTFGMFCHITQKTTPEENSCQMFHISSEMIFFSYGKVKDIFVDKDQISCEEGKRKE